MGRRIVVQKGDKYGRLTVVCEAEPRKTLSGGRQRAIRRFEVECECGTVKSVQLTALRDGGTISCGCFGGGYLKHGHDRSGKRTSTLTAWTGMKTRCLNPNNAKRHRYMGRGIRICDRWMKFENFLEDMGERPSSSHSLDRIDNNGDYEPNNVRWRSATDQARNSSRAKWWFVHGVRYESMTHASESLDLTKKTIINWCNGHKSQRTGKYIPPKEGCYSILKYPK